MSGHVGQSPNDDVSDHPFGGNDVLPFEKQRRAHQFLTQETRYYILQALLGHPTHLASLDELEYLIPKNRSTIREHLDRLQEKTLVTKYVYEGDDTASDEPSEFWGITEFGISLLYEFNYLRYVPVLRALQDNLYLTAKMQRHRNAPRPPLPTAVADAFSTEAERNDDDQAVIEESREALKNGGQLFDAPPIDPDPTATSTPDADRPIDELF